MACALRTFCRSLWRQGTVRRTQNTPNLSSRYSQGVRRFSSASEDLEKAKARLSVLTEDPGNDVKLKLYGLYKQVCRAPLGVGWLLCSIDLLAPPSFTQATFGRCTTKQPGMLDMVGRAKWNAWNSLGELSQVHELMGSVTVWKMSLSLDIRDHHSPVLRVSSCMYLFSLVPSCLLPSPTGGCCTAVLSACGTAGGTL